MAATRSFMVVIRGPEATAGSMFSFLKSMGMQVPAMLDSVMEISRAIADAGGNREGVRLEIRLEQVHIKADDHKRGKAQNDAV